jgi:DNA-binding NarL/FixJ family response regulator
MTNKPVLALVVSSSGSFQNGLLALMTTIHQISAVLVAEDVNSTLRMVEYHQPALVVLDMSLPEMQDVIMQIKAQYPRIQLIVLVEDRAQGEAAEVLGVDGILIKGFSAQQLVDIVENIIDGWDDSRLVQKTTEEEMNTD